MKENVEQIKIHDCQYDNLVIRKGEYEDDRSHTSFIRVYIDCSCEESVEKPVVTFHENEVLSAEDNFKGWFASVVNYFIQNNFKIKDLR